jgi:hypothetical protein
MAKMALGKPSIPGYKPPFRTYYSFAVNEAPLTSPDGSIRISYSLAGEIRFGPAYFHLSIPSYKFGDRIFGRQHVWSFYSRYLAVVEWLTTDYAEGPHTELLLIDFALARQCPLSKANGGFIIPVRFEPPLLIYRKEFLGRGESREYEIAYESLDRWIPIPVHLND